MNKYLQPAAVAILLLAGTGFATAYAPNAIPTAQSPGPARSPNGGDKPIVFAQVPDVHIQLGGDRDRDRDRDMRRHDHQEGVVIVPRRHDRDSDAYGYSDDHRRDRDRDRHDHDRD